MRTSPALEEALNAFADSQLRGRARRSLERALAKQSTLRARLDELRGLKKMVRAAYRDVGVGRPTKPAKRT